MQNAKQIYMYIYLGLDDEAIQHSGQVVEDDDDIKEDEDSHDDTSFT